MSSDAQLVSVERAASGFEAYDAPREAAVEADNPLRRIHLLMQGRYLAAVVLAIVLGAGLATAGVLLGRRLYVSKGAIQVSPVVERPDQGSTSTLPNYDSFLDAQITYLQSQPVREKAMEALKRPITDESEQHFAASIGVYKRGEIIFVDVIDEDPNLAMAEVQALVAAYYELQKEREKHIRDNRVALITQERDSRERKLKSGRADMHELQKVALDHGNVDIDQLYISEKSQRSDWERDLREIELAMAAAGDLKDLKAPATNPSAVAPTTAPSTPFRELTAEEVALHDRRANKLLQQRDNAEDELQVLKRSLDIKHPKVMSAQTALDQANIELRAVVAEFNKKLKENPTPPTQLALSNLVNTDIETQRALVLRLKSRQLRLTEMMRDAEQNLPLQDLVKKKIAMDLLKEDLPKLEAELDRFNKIIDRMDLEGRSPGVVSVLSTGDRPLQPLKDTRITFGAAGGLAGVLLGAGIVLLWGFSDRRLRSAEDARMSISGSQLLGILPTLPETLNDTTQAELASYSVHHIRIMLQVWDRPKKRQAFAVTSPAAGTGKTSLALALGASFAATGTRTLLIDCDVVGGGLTSRVSAFVKRKIGRILLDSGVVTAKQLERALELSTRNDKRLGETLVELGFVEPADLEVALTNQTEAGMGLVDALKGEDILNCITSTDVENLWVLPLGMTDDRHIPMLSPAAAKALIAAARDQFDTIVVDTGPAPASLEAGAVAAAVDGVVLTVSRGEQRPLAEQCVAYLESIGARVVGFVFNRASTSDVERHAGGRSSGWSSRASKKAERSRLAIGSQRREPMASVIAGESESLGK